MRKVLIIGGNRFCGKLTTQKLFDSGYNVTVLNRSGTAPVECNIIKSDRDDFTDFNHFEIVIDMCLYTLKQAEVTFAALEKSAIKQYVFMSSVAVAVDYFGEYGKQKALIEKLLVNSSLPYIVIRPTYIIGKNDHHKRLSYYADKIMNGKTVEVSGDGNSPLTFVFVEDVVEIICKIIERCILYNTYNACSDEITSLNGLVNTFFAVMRKTTEIQYSSAGGPFLNKPMVFPNRKTKKHLDITFRPLKDGIQDYLEWYLAAKS